jgi:tight adherence protein C
MSWDMTITLVSALFAGLTFIAITLPFIQRDQKKTRYQNILNQRRRDLYEAAQIDLRGNKKKNEEKVKKISARQSMANSFRMEQMIGKMAKDLKEKLATAGYRGPKAPLKFMIAKIATPVIFILLAMMVISKMEEEPAKGMQLLTFLGLAAFGFFLPNILVKNNIQKRQAEINTSFPDALDMMLVCVQGGISIEQAINRIADEMTDYAPILAEEIGILGAELGMLNDRREAFQSFANRVGSGAAKSFATSMIQAEKYGTHISTALRVMAEELRAIRMGEAERKAAALPPKLTVPMIMFFLPALFIVILGPAYIQSTLTTQ